MGAGLKPAGMDCLRRDIGEVGEGGRNWLLVCAKDMEVWIRCPKVTFSGSRQFDTNYFGAYYKS